MKVLFALASAEKSQIPIPKYVRKIAHAKSVPASKVFFLLLCLVKMVVSKSNMTAKAQGLIASDKAAGSITQKNHNLFCQLNVSLSTFVVPVKVVSLHAAACLASCQEK